MQVVRLIEATFRISETEPAKSVAELKMSNKITGAKLQTNFEVDSKIASGLKNVINGDFKRRLFIEEDLAHIEKRCVTARQVACNESSSSTSRSATQMSLFWTSMRFLNVEMKNDNAQSFNTRWEETVMTMKYDPDDEIWDFVYHRQLQLSEQLKSLLPLYMFKILFKRAILKTSPE